MDTEDLRKWIELNGIEGLLPKKWIPVIYRTGSTENTLVKSLKHFSFNITGTYPIEKAQLSAGGVPVDEIIPYTFESRLKDKLYITGELLDVDGMCGGYNLHFSFASAILATEDILR